MSERWSERALSVEFFVILPNVQWWQRWPDNSAKTVTVQMSTNTWFMTFKKGENEKVMIDVQRCGVS